MYCTLQGRRVAFWRRKQCLVPGIHARSANLRIGTHQSGQEGPRTGCPSCRSQAQAFGQATSQPANDKLNLSNYFDNRVPHHGFAYRGAACAPDSIIS
ncbi:hypothetical protein K461DRAFT_10623 [Myriangium duriaei CBS 260.36]|uniref:Uncharacterized protein n=1 Tax=Myriangium duriaei CBS 260.36 TaxID=1168546 RepID=A0A9P4J835_9PEZI|nr:hypothetical protein K461DRAFT_10623 [Myriangium duriaei CBS 260.36]